MSPPSDRQAFGARVLQARLEMAARLRRTVTQEEIGEAMGVTGAAVSAWEAGLAMPPAAKIPRLAAILGVRAGWLAWGEEPMRYGQPEEPPDVKLRRA
jgi:transcriptional regulator with XRE-family HTH domain